MLQRMCPPLLIGLLLTSPALALCPQSWTSSGAESNVDVAQEETAFVRDSSAVRRVVLDGLDEVDALGWQALPDLLRDIHERTGVPALAAAYIRDGKVIAHAAAGVRVAGSDEPIAAEDRFHLGSVTKSMTAAVLGGLVERGQLKWSTRLDAVIDPEQMHADYHAVTLEQLLGHRGGLPAYTDGPPEGQPDAPEFSGSPGEVRAAFLEHVMQFPPVVTPGTEMHYSNVGYALAGHIAERVAGDSWEDLVRRFVFEPLGMGTAGFGFPESPLGHVAHGQHFVPVSVAGYPAMTHIAPAGNVHCSVADLARYAAAHLAGLGGGGQWVGAKTVQRLHGVEPQGSNLGYAGGWFVDRRRGERVHWHGGTVGASFALVKLYPQSRSGVVFLTTVEQGIGEAVADFVIRALLERYDPPKERNGPTGFTTSGATAGLQLGEEPAEPVDDARFWRVVHALSNAINDEDHAAFSELFGPNYDARDRDSLFDFMAKSVLPSRGGVYSFHKPSGWLRAQGDEQRFRTVVFHLENGYPGYFGIKLDKSEKLTELSLFVKSGLCEHGNVRGCESVTSRLGEDS